MDKYTKEKIKAIKNAKTNKELAEIVEEIWENGYDIGEWDGFHNAKFWYSTYYW